MRFLKIIMLCKHNVPEAYFILRHKGAQSFGDFRPIFKCILDALDDFLGFSFRDEIILCSIGFSGQLKSAYPNHQRAGNPPSQRSRILPLGPPLLCRQPLQTGQRPEPRRRPQWPQRRSPCLRPLPRNRRGYEAGFGEYVGVRNIERL